MIFGVSVFGGGFDADAALRAGMFALIGTAMAALAGGFRWSTTRYSLAGETIRLRQGMFSVKEVEIPFSRVQAIDVEQGPIQRLFGVYKVQVQTGGGGAGGELVLGAVDEAEVERIRALVGRRAPAPAEDGAARAGAAAVGAPAGARGATSGQLTVLLPVAAAVAQIGQQLFDDRSRASARSSARSPTARPPGRWWRPGCSCSPGCWRRWARSSASAASPSAARATSCGSAAGSCSAARRRCGSAACGPCA